MPEPGENTDLASQAAEDQALAAARHMADCAVRFHRAARDGGISAALTGDLIRIWFRWFVSDDSNDDD